MKDKGEVTMKKLYISCPMRGRTEENIIKSMEKLHKLAEIVFEEELEVIPTYIKDKPPVEKNEALRCLGESIKKMSEADYFIGIDSWLFPGCRVEFHAAASYDIPYYLITSYERMMPDVEEMRKRDVVPICQE